MNVLAELKTRAAQRDLPFLLAGGHAVFVHGYARSTFDIDLIICRNDKSKWRELAKEMGYSFHHEGPTFLQFNAPNAEFLPLDMMLVDNDTFAKLMTDAVPGPVTLSHVKIISVMHLLALKCHAIRHGHKGRIVKDTDDIIHLVQANRLDPNDPAVRSLFLRYGTEDLYEKVRRAST